MSTMENKPERLITEKQGKVLVYISDYMSKMSIPPTYRDIMDALNYSSTNAVNNHIVALENKGYVVTFRGKARAIVLTDKAKQFIKKCQTTN